MTFEPITPVYQAQMSWARLSACMLIFHKGHTDTIQVYSVTVMTHVKALQAGHSSQGISEPITPAFHKLISVYPITSLKLIRSS